MLQRRRRQQPGGAEQRQRAADEAGAAAAGRRTQTEAGPSVAAALLVLSAVRVAGALLAPIQDCDEVYNYWEPLHFLQFGTGKQTWEYAPQFALRSYAFLYGYAGLMRVALALGGAASKVRAFYGLRVCLALASAASETLLVRAVAARGAAGGRAAWRLLAALGGMAGLFHAAPALLPSSFAMVVGTAGYALSMWPGGSLRLRCWAMAAFAVAAAAGWPYAAVTAVPFVAAELAGSGSGSGSGSGRRRRVAALAAVGGGTAAAVLAAMAAVDSWHYGRPVVAAWQQVAYNVLGRGGSPALFGTEPWHFYLRNGLVNANVVLVLALASLPLHGLARVSGRRALLPLSCLLPFHLTLAVFSLQPHKEERFLSIVYPHMCVCAVAALDLLPSQSGSSAGPLRSQSGPRPPSQSGPRPPSQSGPRPPSQSRRFLSLPRLLLAAAACVGALRMAALSVYYTAPMRVFGEAVAAQQGGGGGGGRGAVVCMGAAWHWFPSSYWLAAGQRLQFVTGLGAVGGHLPGDYAPAGQTGSARASTALARGDFNSQNRWEPAHAAALFGADGRSTCDLVVDVAAAFEAAAERRGVRAQWRRVGECRRMLDGARSALLARVLYVPARLAGQRQAWLHVCAFQQAAAT